MIKIVDIEAIRAEAFNFLGRFPDFSRNVIALTMEIETERERIAALQGIREEDSLIISGLVKSSNLANKVCIALDKYTENKIDEIELFKALEAWKNANKIPASQTKIVKIT